MDLTDILTAGIAGLFGFFGAIVGNNKRLSVFEAIITTRIDALQEGQKKIEDRIDSHNHFNDRITKLEVKMEERDRK